MQTSKQNIILFFLIITLIVVALTIILLSLLYLYKKNQTIYYNNIESLKLKSEKSILEAKIEIQESTMQNISREIHDNINLSLTLSKLYLNTFPWDDKHKAETQLKDAINLLGDSISNLRDLSKGLNSDIICNQGLLSALEIEINRIRRVGLFSINLAITGEPIYLNTQKELVIFRIIQEGFNNIIKHSCATETKLSLHFTSTHLHVRISDNGKGFVKEINTFPFTQGAGLKNMETRAEMIGADMYIKSGIDEGTCILFNIPI